MRQLNSMIARLDAAERTFNNSKIKNICPAGRRVLAELHRAEKTVKSRAKCLLATSRDRRSFARIQRTIREAEREFKKAC